MAKAARCAAATIRATQSLASFSPAEKRWCQERTANSADFPSACTKVRARSALLKRKEYFSSIPHQSRPPEPKKRSPGIAGTMHGAGLEGTRRVASFQGQPKHKSDYPSTAVRAISDSGGVVGLFAPAANSPAFLLGGSA
jgi:hypothetical protein